MPAFARRLIGLLTITTSVLCIPLFAQTKKSSVHDTVSNTVVASCNDPDDTTKDLALDKIAPDLSNLMNGTELVWNRTKLYRIASHAAKDPAVVDSIDTKRAYVFHVDHWAAGPPHSLISSDWYVYRLTKDGKLKQTGFTSEGEPLLYGLKRATIIGIEVFDDGGKSGAVKINYKTSVVQGTPANSQALGQLISALLGLASPSIQFAGELGCEVLTSVSFQEGTERLPFELNVAVSAYDAGKVKANAADNPKQSSLAGVADCPDLSSGAKCELSRKFTSEDREWWDVSIGVTIPGVRETKYGIANNSLSSSVKTHTDLYGMFDIYPLSYRWTKDSAIPHLVVGLPLTGQTFYRPFFGVSENLTGWHGFQKKLGLPVGINFFAGIVYMKTARVDGNPTTADQLKIATKYDRVAKPVFGVEVPVKALVSKIGKSASKNNNSDASGNAKSKSSS
ncbi:MAG TPA: hypothetical protein VN025_03790 [Candidatus Dormibacteraeota bacterium]|jgi:hypothetical protein|nr:hypothetical protein [Candidatus Dormibacteraeota bacterium]